MRHHCLGLHPQVRDSMPQVVVGPIFAAGLLLLALTSPLAHSAPIEFQYGGVIASAADGMNLAPGTRIQGSFIYDPQAGFSTMSSGGWITYQYSAGSLNSSSSTDSSGLSFGVNGEIVAAALGGLQLGMTDFRYLDQLGAGASRWTTFTILGKDLARGLGIFLEFDNSTRSVFDSIGPPRFFNLADFPGAGFSIEPLEGTGRPGLLYSGRIDTLIQVTTPEPSAVALWLGLGAAGYAIRARMRRGDRG